MKRHAFLAAATIALWGRPVLGELLELPARPGIPTLLPQGLARRDSAAQEQPRKQVAAELG